MGSSLRNRILAVVLCALALSSLGCMKKPPRGQLVGAYAISAQLVENTCGNAALPTQNPLTYEVQLRDDNGVGTWQLDKQGGQSGILDDDGSFLFQAELTQAMGQQAQPKKVLEPGDFLSGNPEPDLKTANCTLVRRETMQGIVHRRVAEADGGTEQLSGDAGDAGTDTADLTGKNIIEVQPAAGSDCSLQLASSGGAYTALPCRAEYEIEGTLQASE